MKKNDYIVKNAWICRVKNQMIEPVFGNIEVHAGKIHKIIPASFDAFMKTDLSNEDPNIIDVQGRIVTLPLINFHDHFYSRLAKGLPIAGPTDNFEHILEHLWWKLDMALDGDMIAASTRMSILEAIRNGVTTIFDHHASPAHTSGSLNIIAATLREYGMRGVLCFETSDRNGPVLSARAVEENSQFLRNGTGQDIQAMFGLHASFTLEDDTLKQVSELIRDLNAGIHIHLCEDKADSNISRRKFGRSPVERLQKFELMNHRSILSHAIHLAEDEYAVIADSGAAIAVNLDSNLNNAVGIPGFSRISHTIPLLMGTDGMHDNLSRAFKQAFLLHRHQGNGFDISFPWMEKIFRDQLKFVKQYFPDFPTLNEGDIADFIVYDYILPAPLTKENFWGHYIYGILERPVQSVVHNGTFLMKDYSIEVMDEAAVSKEIYRQGERLLQAYIKL